MPGGGIYRNGGIDITGQSASSRPNSPIDKDAFITKLIEKKPERPCWFGGENRFGILWKGKEKLTALMRFDSLGPLKILFFYEWIV